MTQLELLLLRQSSCDQPSTTFSRAADIANFDLGFQIDDDVNK